MYRAKCLDCDYQGEPDCERDACFDAEYHKAIIANRGEVHMVAVVADTPAMQGLTAVCADRFCADPRAHETVWELTEEVGAC